MSYGRTADWSFDDAAARADVRRKFWRKARRAAARVPFMEDLVAAYYCAFDRNTPRRVQATLIGALAYFIMPFDALPDMMLALGFTDDMAVLAGVVRLMASHITQAHRDAARAALARGLSGE